jgi:anti-sigma factor (TIGR02949 family)
MRCARRDADLQAFLDGELGPSQMVEVQQHVAGCPACQRRLQFFHEVRFELRAHTVSYKAPQPLREQLATRFRRFDRRRRLLRFSAVALIALAPLIGMSAVDWLYTDQTGPPLLAEIVNAHAALVRDQTILAFPTVDADLARRWLDQRLPFRPMIPQAGWGGFQLVGATSLSLSAQEAAFLLFGKGDRRVSLASFANPSYFLGSGRKVAMDGITFWIFMQGVYTIVMWSQHGFSYVMVSDDEVEESLEYARLCAQHIRTPT